MRSIFEKKIHLRPLTRIFADCILVAHPLDSVVFFHFPIHLSFMIPHLTSTRSIWEGVIFWELRIR